MSARRSERARRLSPFWPSSRSLTRWFASTVYLGHAYGIARTLDRRYSELRGDEDG